MPPTRVKKIATIDIENKLLNRKDQVMYLVPINEAIKKKVDVEFTEAQIEKINGYVTALVTKGKMPPAAIAPAIMNFVDDVGSGREITLKTGDYASLQGYLRTK